MDSAVGWCKERQHNEIRLETQDNNLQACRFYIKYGFPYAAWIHRNMRSQNIEMKSHYIFATCYKLQCIAMIARLHAYMYVIWQVLSCAKESAYLFTFGIILIPC